MNVHAVAGVTPTQSRVAALRAQSATLTPSACSERRACARAGLSGERIGLAVLSRSTMQGQTRMPAPSGPWNSYCTGLQWVRTAPAADHAILGAPRCIQVPPGLRGRAASEQRLPPPTGISGAAAGGTPGTQCRSRTERMEDLLAGGT